MSGGALQRRGATHRTTVARSLALLWIALAAAAAGARAEPAAPETPVMRAPESVPSLDALIRAGLERQAHGDLAGADAQWRLIREHHPEHPAGPVFEKGHPPWITKFGTTRWNLIPS